MFIVLVVLFFLVAPLVIFYSQGYRFDFEAKKFFQTGAFSFKVWPRGALVFIDGKLAKKTSFPFGTVYIENLLPKKYTVEIKKEGYLSWEKTLEIKERWVTENKNIFLVPESSQFDLLEKNIDDFFFSSNGKKAILNKREKEKWILVLFNLEGKTSSVLFGAESFSTGKEKVNLAELKWSPDSKKLLLKTDKENSFFVVEIDESPSLYPLDFLKSGVTSASFILAESEKLLFSQESAERNNLFIVNYKNREISGPVISNFLTFEVLNNGVFWLDNEGFLNQSDFSGNKIHQFNKEPFILDNNFSYQLFIFSENKIFVKKENGFYFFNQEKQLLEKILEGVKEIKISPDLKKIVYFTNNEIWLLFLENIEGQPGRIEGEKLFLSRFSEKIGNVFWWTSHYLIFSVGKEIRIIEIDNRNGINNYNLPTVPTQAEMFWNNSDKKLYILSEGDLFSSQKLY